ELAARPSKSRLRVYTRCPYSVEIAAILGTAPNCRDGRECAGVRPVGRCAARSIHRLSCQTQPGFSRSTPAMIDWLQWPAMVATLVAAWLVASQRRRRRLAGFALFVVSNILWIAWALPIGAHALIVLQVGLFALNVRGIKKNDPDSLATPEP